MKLLLDTCTTLWLATGSPHLSRHAAASFSAPSNEVLLSAVSVWEMAIKHALGRLPLPRRPDAFVARLRADFDIAPLPFDEASALRAGALPPLHRDPFDRALIGLAIEHGLTILTPDPMIQRYGVRTAW